MVVQCRYALIRELGRGATGTVHEAEDRVAGARVAVKTAGARAVDRERLLREHAVLRRCTHPHVVRALDLVDAAEVDASRIAGAAVSGPALVLEHLEGPSLEHARLSRDEALRAWAQVAEAVQALHEEGVVHRDLKPSNVLLRGGSEPRADAVLIDLGSSAAAESADAAGTLDYLAPEVVIGLPGGPAADTWSLGALLLFLLTGRPPFAELRPGESLRARRRAPPNVDHALPAPLRRTLLALLAPSPDQRPSSPRAAVALLDAETGSSLLGEATALRALPGVAPWIGRTALLARATEWIEAARPADAGVRVIAIRGPAGSGRSRLLDEVELRARLLDVPVARAVPSTREHEPLVLLDEPAADAAPPAPASGTWLLVTDRAVPGAEVVDLLPFDERECLELAAAVLGLPPPRGGDAGALVGASGGWPGALERVVRALAERGQLAWRARELRVREGALDGLPDVQQALRQRIDALSPLAAALLDRAVVLGRPATTSLLARLAAEDDTARVAGATAELVAAGLFRPVAETEDGWSLEPPDHVRSAVVRSLGPARLRMLHLATAGVLARHDHGSEGEQAEHLAAAGLPERAAPLHLAAGELLLRGQRPAAAARHLRLAADAGQLQAGERARALVLLARAQAAGGDAAAAVRTVERALPDLREDRDRAEALALAAEAASHAGDPAAAEEACRQARRLFRKVNSSSGRGECASRLGLLAAGRGDLRRARAGFRAALALARREGDHALEARVLNNMGGLARDEGDWARAVILHASARDLRRQAGDVRGAARAINNLGIVHGLAGRLDEAAAAFAEAIAAFRECGDRQEEGRALNNRGMALWRAERHAEADDAFRQAAEIFDELGHAALRADAARNRALVALDRGRLGEALATLEELAAGLHERAPRERASALLDVADARRAAGDHAGAAARQDEAATLFAAAGQRDWAAAAGAAAAHSQARLGAPVARPSEAPEDDPTEPDCALRWHLEAAAVAEATGDGRAGELARRASALARLHGGRRDRVTAASLVAGARPDAEAVQALLEELAGLRPSTCPDVAWPARLRAARGLAAADRPFGAAAQAEVAREDLRQLAESCGDAGRVEFMAVPEHRAALDELEALASAPLTMRSERLSPVLLEFVRLLNQNLDVEALLPRIVDFALELTGAERGALILFDEGPGRVRVARSREGRDLPRDAFPHSSTIVERVRRTGDVVSIESFGGADVPRSQSVHDLQLGSATCVPLPAPAGVAGGLLGALYVDSPTRRSAFGQHEVALLQAMAVHAAAALVNGQLLARVRADREALQSEVDRLRGGGVDEAFGEALGRSAAMRQVFALLERVAVTDASVLVEGESGTGKELVARALHARSRRAAGPFIAVDCGSLPEPLIESELLGHRRGAFTGADRDRPGLFEQATGGTIFLDEIAGTTPALQAKLLRVLQEREVRRVGDNTPRPIDVRVVAASNRSLAGEVAAGRFREDLFYRLNVVTVVLPPLRERPEDVPLLARHLLQRVVAREGLPLRGWQPAALQLLARHSWPGNVRELANVVERAAVMTQGPEITPFDLPAAIAGRQPETDAAPPSSTQGGETRAGGDLWTAVVDRGESFWTTVRDPFTQHDITRADVLALVSQGLLRTAGSYRELTRLLGIAPEDYKRFMDFLRQNRCQVDFRPYRAARSRD